MDMHQPSTNDISFLLNVSNLFQHLAVDDVLRQLLALAQDAVHATEVSIIVFRENEVAWQHYVGGEIGGIDAVPNVNDILRYGLAGWVLRNKQMAIVQDAQTDERWLKRVPSVQSALSVPLLYRDDLLAIMTMSHTQRGHFVQHHADLIQIIANQAAIAIHNARLFEELQSAQEQTRAVLRAFPNTVFVMDDVGRLMIINDAMLTLLGKEYHEQATGHRLTDMPKRDPCLDAICENLLDVVAHPLQPIKNMRFEVTSQALGRDFLVTISTWGTAKKRVSGYVIVLHDITEIRDLARFKDEMLRIASHDLRNPLSLIIGYADMVAVDTPDDASPVHDHVRAIMRSADRMDRLLAEILRVEKIRQTPLELHECIHPKILIVGVMVDMQQTAESKQIRFGAQLNLDFADVLIHADPVLIQQAMENMVANALKYTAPGGNVAIISRVDFNERRFHFVVVDNGVGIPADKLKYVFESFFRVDAANVHGVKGTGLGLSLVKAVIEKHGGGVWVNSTEHVGSRFGFWLPLARPSDCV